MPPGPLEIKELSYLTDTPPSDMTTNNVKLYQPRLLHCQCKIHAFRDMLCCCVCNIYACWPSVTATNTAAVQICLMVEYFCYMDAWWTMASQSAYLPTFCHLILPLILHVWCLTISRACWCSVLL